MTKSNIQADSNLVLVVPHRDLHVDDELRRKVAAYLATNLTNGLTTTQVLRHVPTVLNAYGKVKFLNGGDMIHSALTYSISDSEHRDASFVKVRFSISLAHQLICALVCFGG